MVETLLEPVAPGPGGGQLPPAVSQFCVSARTGPRAAGVLRAMRAVAIRRQPVVVPCERGAAGWCVRMATECVRTADAMRVPSKR